MEKKFLNYIVKMSAIAKVGKQYSKDPYALDNFEEMNNLTNDMLKDFAKVDYERPDFFERDVYPTPNISVRIVIFDDRKNVLLVQSAQSHLWNLPGGYCDLFDSPSIAARKHCKKEVGAEVELIRLVGVADRTTYKKTSNIPEYVIVFEGRLAGPKGQLDYKTLDARFFRMNELPLIDDRTSDQEVSRYITTAFEKATMFD